MQRLIYPIPTVNNTCTNHKTYKAWDIAGKDTGIESADACCYLKVLNKLPSETSGFSNTAFFGTCDENGNEAAVLCNDNNARVLTISMTHDNDISDISIGHIYTPGERIYDEGTKGNATGNHIHMEVAEGWQYKKKLNSAGSWVTINAIDPDLFFLLKGFNTIKRLNGMTEVWTDSREVIFGIYYEGNASGVSNIPTNQTKEPNETIYISTNVPKRDGYKFKYWTVFDNGSGTRYNPGDKYAGDWSSTLYAAWEQTADISNAMQAFQAVAGKTDLSESDKQKLDVDGDGDVDLTDAMNLFKNVAGKE